jgi:hypothetical protein
VGDGTFSMTGTQLKINVPAGPNHDGALNGVNSAPRVVQAISNSDFTVTVKFDSIPSQQYQFQGIVIDQDAGNYLRIQFGSGGSFLAFSADKLLSHTETGLFSEYDHPPRRDYEPLAAAAARRGQLDGNLVARRRQL